MSDTVKDPAAVKPVDVEKVLARLAERRRTPVSTYRLQMHRDFGFKKARDVLGYLFRLGVTDCYTSSLLKAQPGSMHGYDICDHNQLNPELGSDSDYATWVRDLKEKGIGLLLDFVPNHMGNDPGTNPWWRDVLENGRSSPYARFFDIDWDPVKPELQNRVLLPILGDQYGVVLEKGELKLQYAQGALSINYYDNHLPVNPRAAPRVLGHGIAPLRAELGEFHPDVLEFLSILTELSNLPSTGETNPGRIEERQREKEVARARLARLTDKSPAVAASIERSVAFANGSPDDPKSFDLLHQLLEAQAYRLASWKTASQEINYRRFFDINQLSGVRMENPDVFAATHTLVLRLLAQDDVTGLRLDHVDGLYDPAGYFEALQIAFLDAWVRRTMTQGSDQVELPADLNAQIRAWRTAERKRNINSLAARPLYLSAEKILSRGETLDPHWMIDGTSGYDFLNSVNGVFVDASRGARLRDIYAAFTGRQEPFSLLTYECKKLIMSTSMASELNVLAHALNVISEHDRRSRDFTLESLRDALKELVACVPIYRTYINAGRCGPFDRETIEKSIRRAKRYNPAMEATIFDFIQDVLLPQNADRIPREEFLRQIDFAMKFQQYSGPVQAKGLEDTAFYRYNVLLSLNEVNGDPGVFGTTVKQFHDSNRWRHEDWPHTMLATATHDTKRGEDSRARINVLSEIPDEWEKHVGRWAEINAAHRTLVDDAWAPDRNDEYMFYQALLGAWSFDPASPPIDDLSQRLRAFMTKAIREAKRYTSWVNPNQAYEKAVDQFVQKTLTGEGASVFLDAFVPLARHVAQAGVVNSLAQVVLKLASPGVADFYQGCELWDLNLVDPDNRRPVDYLRREKMLSLMETAGAGAVGGYLDTWEDGRVKLWTTFRGLSLRREHSDLFLNGSYIPLEAEGEGANHIVAFARTLGDQTAMAIVPRLSLALRPAGKIWPVGAETWKNTILVLPASIGATTFHNVLTDEQISIQRTGDRSLLPVSSVLASYPVALLAGKA